MKRILVVDDSRLILRMEQAMLAERYEVLTALTAAEAVLCAVERQPDLVLTDFNLDGPNGQQLCDALAGDHRTRDIKVVVVTTENQFSKLRQNVDRLAKPFDKASLLGKVERCLAERSPVPESASRPGDRAGFGSLLHSASLTANAA